LISLVPVTFCGRTFTAQEVALMREVAHDYSGLAITEIARTMCELLEWKRPNGRLKDHECRQLLERLAAEGMLRLPAVRRTGRRGPRRVETSQPRLQPEAVECAARECEPLELVLVEGPLESRLWREHVERYHYLGSRVPFGSNLRYWVRNRQRELACLLWTSPAWKMKPRDSWIGWSDEQRQRNLQSIVNNGRFLILPWVHVKGLASKILARSARQLPTDWETHYGHRPLLLETLVDASRFRGTCYRAANWIYLGHTAGRGRMDREHKAHGQAIKDIYIYPLVSDPKQRLCSGPTR
jgi:Druantia protein DruA